VITSGTPCIHIRPDRDIAVKTVAITIAPVSIVNSFRAQEGKMIEADKWSYPSVFIEPVAILSIFISSVFFKKRPL
jgi:hypothetical protein